VKALQAKDDAILHLGSFLEKDSTFEKGQEVALEVDGEKRKLHARYHSAGHLLDIAVRRCGQTQLQPGKGYHFPVGAYVEYIGVVDNSIKDKLP
jgi:Ser-tRNA(Ala) deacylase AlaX